MKVLKYILFTIGGIIALVLIIALFIPKKYTVERAVVIQAPQPLVMDQLRYLKNANAWSPFTEKDPDIQITYAGTDGQVGASSHWESKKAGVGTQTITSLSNDRMETRLDFKKPMESTSVGYFQTQDEAGGVKVTWGMKGENPYPLNFMCLFMDNMLGKEFDKGLNNLKVRAEGMAKGAPAPAAI